jgi:YD repeat-containing protein
MPSPGPSAPPRRRQRPGFLTGTSAGTPDTGSPVGPLVTEYHDGANDWVIVRTDEEGKVRKLLIDGFGRTNQIIEVTTNGNFTSLLKHDRLGQLTNLTDHAGNKIEFAYNDLGEQVALADPNLGVWEYRRDIAGRLREQVLQLWGLRSRSPP